MRRAIISLLTFLTVLVNATHLEAHASGRHSHDNIAHEASHHVDASPGDEDRGQDDQAPATAEHVAGHSHIAADRALPVWFEERRVISAASAYLGPPQVRPPTAPLTPLLQPPAA